MRPFALPLTLMLVLSACAPSQVGTDLPTPQPASVSNITPAPTEDPALLPIFPNAAGNSDLSRLDEQGAVVVEVTPLNLDTPADTLEFDITMNTHSVDLIMDLAALSVLSTDTGLRLQATEWDATAGGHHVSGKLIFPAMNDGTSILEDASTLTLTIVNVDAASRVFEWELP